MGKGEQTRTTIIEAALREASICGIHGLSIGGLADHLQMSKSGLFAHFGSKEALQHAVLESLVELFTQQVVVPVLKIPDGLERMRGLYRGFIQWMEDNRLPGGCPILALSFELDARPGPLRDYVAAQQARWMDVIRRVARKCIDAGYFRADLDVDQFAFEFEGIAFVLNYASQLLRDANAAEKARIAFERLIADARAGTTIAA